MTINRYWLVLAVYQLSLTFAALGQIPEFNSENAYNYLKKQCEFGPRNPGSDGHTKCRNWLLAELNKSTSETYTQPFSAIESLTGNKVKLYNIIGQYGDSDEFGLMLCAHWDTRVHADQDDDVSLRKTPVLGANDGASGVAVILEICRIMAENPPPRPITVVFFDGEDMGRTNHSDEFALGSEYWATHPIPFVPEDAILLDMVGDTDLEIPIELYSYKNAPDLIRTLWNLADIHGLDAFQDYYGSPVTDDHLNLQRVGIRAIDIIDFDYPFWHTTEDTPDKCSAESLYQVGTLLVKYIYGNE